MVRNYKRKKPQLEKEKLKLAVLSVLRDKKTIRTAAKEHGVNRTTLQNWVKNKTEEQASKGEVTTVSKGFQTVLSAEAESALAQYLLKCNDLYFGLTTRQVRALAYDYAKKLDVPMPIQWIRSEMAGIEWIRTFLRRQSQLSVRKPEATSLARATAFNRYNVGEFFSKLKEVCNKYQFPPQNIYNMDETGVTTVQVPDRVVSRKGMKQVGRIVSAERGTLVTLAVAVSATGNTIPPFFVFPRKKFKNNFLIGGPVGCGGAGNPSGWMNGPQFYEFLGFFQAHAHASLENPVLLILDNHESHLSIKGLDYCKENGIVVLSLPPHCSHKLQPLDRSVFGPFKKVVNTQCDNWVTSNPGTTMTIYHVPGIVKDALPLASTHKNVTAGFVCTGIFPLNENIFEEHEFMPSMVTDRAQPAAIAGPSTSIAGPSGVELGDLDQLCCICCDKLLKNQRFKLCIVCRRKAHVACVRTSDNIFTCVNCFSEPETDSEEE
ncbi:tigger transposable element-derived protein 6-like [Sitodiplosis mosellana]|uniref:tigger transposable element-derived protein 6-like n=1 Tax=Sitodiplosis mosellana TaxID=263140 RepID=UPI002443F5C9|nr:tigger transposable element-derived protein 6-like [Sitodiplosis mosellana]